MWIYIVRHILRNRLLNLILIGLITVFMGYRALDVEMSYEFNSLLPQSDTAAIEYTAFQEKFGKDGSVMFVGFQDEKFFTLEKFNDWNSVVEKLRAIDGVEEVVAASRLFHLVRNDSLKKFDFKPVVEHNPLNDEEMEKLKEAILSLPFYKGLLINEDDHVYLTAITLEEKKLNTKGRMKLVHHISDIVNQYGNEHDVNVRISGLPFIRTITSEKLEQELKLFVIIALFIASFLLLLFFRSIKAVIFPMLIVLISLIWVLGTMSLFGYKITMLTGIFPPLLIVIVVENSIFLLNKYYTEFKIHGNKIRSLSRVVQRIGNANLLTNATTAAGFGAFIVTGNKLLVEFGVIASLNILGAYILTLFLIPIFFSYLPDPKERHVKHLSKSLVTRIIQVVVNIVQTRRRYVYVTTIVILVIAFFGIIQLETTGKIVDDIPQKDQLYKDLVFLEDHFNGVMPLEITIDTKKPKGVLKLSTLKKIDRLQDSLRLFQELSRSLSVVEVAKFAKQAFYKNNPEMYSLPNNQEKNFIMSYIPDLESSKRSILNSFVDSTLQHTRISTQMKNIGTYDIKKIDEHLRTVVDTIFNPEKFNVSITGTSIIFYKGTRHLVKNLFTSLLLAIVIITILMALMFTSIRMIIISLIPNVIPLLLTAAMMGYTGIPIKPSTILIFSIALGISVDNAIHFLSRYRLQLKVTNWRIGQSAIAALKETGFSMIYSSVVLFFGFIIFVLSNFGGTEALGYLIAFTLVVALLSNLLLLPTLIMSLDKYITTKTFEEPFLDIFDEEEDIDLAQLEIENIDQDLTKEN